MVRVYELAQELGITNKDLVIELEKMNVAVKSHMSSIKEDEIQGVKNRLAPAKTQEVVEKRIKSTVIRRRIRKIKPEVKLAEVKLEKTVVEEAGEPEPKREVRKPVSKKEVKKFVAKKEKDELPAEKEKKDLKKAGAIPEKKDTTPPEVDTVKLDVKKKPVTDEKPPKKKVVYKSKDGARKRAPYRGGGARFRPSGARTGQKSLQKQAVGKTEVTVPKAIKRKIRILEVITVGELAKRMGVKVGDVVKKLLDLGVVATINQPLDIDTASLIAGEFSCHIESTSIEEGVLERKEDAPDELVHRPPVVTVMGHVDHGKTSLLDAIRKTNVIDKEAGGITQHIGAYHVPLPKGNIVFLDTPGHEAFTAMRARGAQVTDIVVLVVAADDGVMSQTVEAINHAKAAGVTLMVAINKIDKPNADLERVKRSLMEHELIPEELGGDTVFVEVSAKKGLGINNLLELILLQAEMLELKANPNKSARGVVIEAKLDRGRGPVATVLIQEGTLKNGDPFVAGANFGKIRALNDDKGRRREKAGPAIPIEIVGLSGIPEPGDSFIVVDDEKKARHVAVLKHQKKRELELAKSSKISLEELFDRVQNGDIKELNIVVRADTHGSGEALFKALGELSTDAIKVNIIHSSVGAIVESDVMLASASNAIIIGFNVKSDPKVQQIAELEKVSVRFYTVIYDVISDIKKAMVGLLEPILEEKVLGRAEIRDTFKVSNVGTIAGSFVLNGKIVKGEYIRLLRDNVVVYDGKISSLKRFKDDVREVLSGYECGISVESFNDIKIQDILESYTYEKIAPTL